MQPDLKSGCIEQALTLTGLDDFTTALAMLNDAFLQKMNERTETQAWQQKGSQQQPDPDDDDTPEA